MKAGRFVIVGFWAALYIALGLIVFAGMARASDLLDASWPAQSESVLR